MSELCKKRQPHHLAILWIILFVSVVGAAGWLVRPVWAASQQTSTTTAQSIINQARVYLNNTDTTPWTDAQLLQYVNDGMVDIVTYTQCLETTESIDLAADTIEYTITSTYLTVKAVQYIDSSSLAKALIRGSPAGVGHEEDVGEPVFWYDWAGKIGAYPSLDSRTTETLTVYLITRPTAITLTDNITIPAIYDKALVKYVVAQAWIKDKQHAKYGQFMNEYYQTLNFLKTTLTEMGNRRTAQ